MTKDQPLFGLGFRAKHYDDLLIAGQRDASFLEIMTENYLHHARAKKTFLDGLAATWPISLHGVGLSIGGSDPLNRQYLESLRLLVKRLRPKFVTDHLCWTSFRGHNTHDLLPLPYTDETLKHAISRVMYVQDILGERLYLENPSAYTSFLANTMEEADFLSALVKESGCGILLDVNNLYVVHHNLDIDPKLYLAKLDPSSIAYLHMAGHTDQGDLLIDTHDTPVTDAVASLYESVVRLFPQVPTVLEWDGEAPAYRDLITHLNALKTRHEQALKDPRHDDHALPTAAWHLRPQHTVQPATATLHEIQERFFHLITSLERDPPADEAILAILDARLPAPATLGLKVYRDAYWLRLMKVIRSTYPCLLSLLGPKHFSDIARHYLAQFPPCEPDIKFAGQHLGKFLLKYSDLPFIEVPPQVLADIAALEWAKYDALDDCDTLSGLSSMLLSRVTADAWPHVTVDFNPQIRVVTSNWKIGSVMEEFASGQKPAKPKPHRSAYLVRKKDDDVQVSCPDWLEYQLFEKLRNGLPFEEALVLCHGRELTEDDVCQGVTWLSEWCSAGLVAGLCHDHRNL